MPEVVIPSILIKSRPIAPYLRLGLGFFHHCRLNLEWVLTYLGEHSVSNHLFISRGVEIIAKRKPLPSKITLELHQRMANVAVVHYDCHKDEILADVRFFRKFEVASFIRKHE